MYKRKPLCIGHKFNKLTLIKEVENSGIRKGEFLCDCGNSIIKTINTVKTGHTKSCGCLTSKTHGMSINKFYKIYDRLKGRLRPSHQHYKYYGGKGIKCEWNSFEEFRDDMYNSYLEHCKKFGEKQTTIDRINNDGNYCKDNCRWATLREQQKNRSCALNYKGKNFMDYCRELGFNEHTFRTKIRALRIKENISQKDAFIKIIQNIYNI